jgi:hypothetical protein
LAILPIKDARGDLTAYLLPYTTYRTRQSNNIGPGTSTHLQ